MEQKVKELIEVATKALEVLQGTQAEDPEDWYGALYPFIDQLDQTLTELKALIREHSIRRALRASERKEE